MSPRNDTLVTSALRLIVGVLGLVCCAAPLRCAEVFYLDHDEFTHQYVGPVGPLVVSGALAAGDVDRVLAKILERPEQFLARDLVMLAASGDAVGEAIKLASLLQALHASVRVGTLTGPCTGACFLIYAAADERATDDPHLLGITRLGAPESAAPRVREFLRVNAVPAQFSDKLLGQGGDEVYWLSGQDAAALQGRSAAFIHYLASRCRWDADLERAALSGQRPLDALQPMWECRRRETLADARRVLADARRAPAKPRTSSGRRRVIGIS
jgi:hypothetical protein